MMEIKGQQLLFDLGATLPALRTWALCRDAGAKFESVLERAVRWYLDKYGAFPSAVRVCPVNEDKAREHLSRLKWGTVAVVVCGGMLRPEVEVPYKEVDDEA